MEAERVKLFSVRLPLQNPWTLSRGTSGEKHYWFLRVQVREQVAWGEAAHNARYGESLENVGEALRSILQDPGSVDQWKARAPRAAAACWDILQWDIAGRTTGESLASLLSVPRTAPPHTSFSIGLDEPGTMQKKLLAAPKFEVYKIKLGTPRDREIIGALREVTSAPLRVDANEGWPSKEVALDQIEWLAGQGVELIEQPLPAGHLPEMRWLKERSPLPLVADEDLTDRTDLPRLADAYHGINVKLMKLGGISPALDTIEDARRLGMKVMLGCMIETSVGIAAAAHISQLADWVDLDGHLLLAKDPFTGLRLQGGRVLTNGLPGLGVEWAQPETPWHS